MHSPLIYCVGDSHTSFFSGTNNIQPEWPALSTNYYPFFKTARLGPILAYNLCKEGAHNRGREKLFVFLKERTPKDHILLSFGEIDCRAHLVKECYKQQRTLESVVSECVNRYFSVIKEIQTLGFELMIYNAIPSTTSSKIPDIKDPIFGTWSERTNATKLFNEYLCDLCIANKIYFLSIYEKLINLDGSPKKEFFMDEIHLSQRAMPLMLSKLKDDFPDYDFSLLPFFGAKRRTLIFCRRIITKLRKELSSNE